MDKATKVLASLSEANAPSVGTRFKVGKTEYEIRSIKPIDPEHQALIRVAKETGKDLSYYHAAKVLQSGKLSAKVGGVFLRFTKTDRYISSI